MSVDWRVQHGEIIEDFLKFLNRQSEDYILKGGTSLMMCYNLDRFSEDIDLDCTRSKQIKSIVDNYCSLRGFSYRVAKDTDTVKRFMINYGRMEKPLKVEISYRKKHIEKSEYLKKNGITVYSIDSICMMKVNAYSSRDKIRDLYDLTFICNNYWQELSPVVINMVRNCVEFKGLEQFDYLINQQSDELIDSNKLANDFLEMYEKLGLLIGDDEKEFCSHITEKEQVTIHSQENTVDDSMKTPQNTKYPFSRNIIKDNAKVISEKSAVSQSPQHKKKEQDL